MNENNPQQTDVGYWVSDNDIFEPCPCYSYCLVKYAAILCSLTFSHLQEDKAVGFYNHKEQETTPRQSDGTYKRSLVLIGKATVDVLYLSGMEPNMSS